MSVSWPRAARAVATVAAAIAALALLPSLLRSPEPPPLDPKIGLAGVGTTERTAPGASAGRAGDMERHTNPNAAKEIMRPAAGGRHENLPRSGRKRSTTASHQPRRDQDGGSATHDAATSEPGGAPQPAPAQPVGVPPTSSPSVVPAAPSTPPAPAAPPLPTAEPPEPPEPTGSNQDSPFGATEFGP
ncbi:MAG: hypothetical protein H0V25_02135 [Solirubrobacterales bacterium]|nr:hypothetical protein [Solirubrobacterales bacterium]